MRKQDKFTQDINYTNDPQKNYRLGMVSKDILLGGLNPSQGTPTPSELKLNKADTETAFLNLHLSISNIVSTKIYDKRDNFDFVIVGFPCLDGDVPRSTSYGVYISQLIRFW